MELFSLQSSPLTILPSSSPKVSINKQSLLSALNTTNPNIQRYPDARKLNFPHFRAKSSVSVQASVKANLGIAQAMKQEGQPKDENLIFVAGATGKVGSRTVRELLKLGFRVRAGVRSVQRAENLVQSVQQMKLDEGTSAVEKLEIVECDLEKDKIEPAIANASVVICCIGASEKEVFDVTGPYRIDYQATKNLIDAATVAGVDHFILLTSLGTNKVGFPAAILNLFWGVLIWKRKAEEALIASGLPYTIVRPGGMERPTDAYKETHNVSLAKEDTLFGGQVSNLQVAELMAFMAKNRSVSYCKVVEVIAETTAPLSPFGELLSKIPYQRTDNSSAKEPQIAQIPDPGPAQSVVPETIDSVIEKEPIQTKVQIARPLSPYIAYEDLKPPTSPTPTPSISPTPTESGGIKEHANVVQAASGPSDAVTQINISEINTGVTEITSDPVEVQNTGPLSPYTAYEDLKPPTSPGPRPSAAKNGSIAATVPVEEVVPVTTSGSDVAEETPAPVVENPTAPNENTSHLSPYHAYDDLKPPTSPSPSNAQTVPLFSTSMTETGSQVYPTPDSSTFQPTSDKPEDKQESIKPKPRPLSPFPMYEDLKPPCSPMPSPRKH